MIGIVIVSHSKKLAEGIRELAAQMTQGKAAIAIAAGIDDPDNPLGTDATQILEAIESVYSEDGVVVFMDLGSAIISAETALDLLPDDKRRNVYLCEAPLVEGVLAASVQASSSGDMDSVVREARESLGAKKSQLGTESMDNGSPKQAAVAGDSREIVLTVQNKMGLHARPAAKFVSTASTFQSEIFVKNLSKNTDFVNAKSINQIITLGVRKGHEIMIAASGPDADEAILTLQKMIKDKFDEAEEEPDEADTTPRAVDATESNELTGIPVSSGIAIGPAYVYKPSLPEVREYVVQNIDAEVARFQNAIEEVKNNLETLQNESIRTMDQYDAAIFEAHLLYLNDPALTERTQAIIHEQQMNAEAAWQMAIEEMVSSYQSLDDPIVRDRQVDLLDVAAQVIYQLTGLPRQGPDPDTPSVVVAQELNPSETAQLKPEKILGLCCERGNKTSHSAIMARSLGIPAVFGVGPSLRSVEESSTIIVDGGKGKIILEPTEAQITYYRKQQEEEQRQRKVAERTKDKKAVTRDGRRVEVVANVSSISEIKTALANGAEGIGLFRTEFLYMNRTAPPSETEQYEIYRQAAELLGDLPCIIRTIDVGGDKPVPYLRIKKEANPFLGWRGIRYCLDEINIFKTQLRAILRASHNTNVKIMFPMVATIREVRAAKAIVSEVMEELTNAGFDYNRDIEIGIMIEVPSAVIAAQKLINEVDFFSIGTNDLTQYTMAADRTNERVSSLADPFEPSVLSLIRDTISAAHKGGKWVGMCGEMAGDLEALPVLLGFGLDEFSMSPSVIPQFKEKLSTLTMDTARSAARKALQCTSSEEVKQLCSHLIR